MADTVPTKLHSQATWDEALKYKDLVIACIKRVVRNHKYEGLDPDIFLSAGMEGCCRAVETFPTTKKKITFESYAYMLIKCAVFKEIRNEIETIHIPPSGREIMFSGQCLPVDILFPHELPEEETDDGEPLASEVVQSVEEYLGTLRPSLREVVELSFGFRGREMDHADIAEHLNNTCSNISKYFSFAMMRMRRYHQEKLARCPSTSSRSSPTTA